LAVSLNSTHQRVGIVLPKAMKTGMKDAFFIMLLQTDPAFLHIVPSLFADFQRTYLNLPCKYFPKHYAKSMFIPSARI